MRTTSTTTTSASRKNTPTARSSSSSTRTPSSSSESKSHIESEPSSSKNSTRKSSSSHTSASGVPTDTLQEERTAQFASQQARRDGTVYGRLVDLPEDLGPYSRVSSYTIEAARVIDQFDGVFDPVYLQTRYPDPAGSEKS